ncbi:MATE family efflux transporter [Clostridium tagluense]|uniref:Multidrug export protein MepA n=1 Tax=Clostridium tagluense TaxID=360422 RepID=A0A401UMZ7_9CLOT|nr:MULTISPECIES: MATE family efflux transporter [Clostridium]MBU3130251.1 MATE family efflux transporter [Clostridium tagluense]MBW9157248.1 MATE family efflux transporter [Clostridium tagluense]MBZ9623389.1 MATE family efflux transporter [Clostridium sp. FP2]MCB2310960.1 MATE family efflux transporter [Clostridium tagluense]MCB2315814.1 MATE family efflux transporter [Clostridium tagluense]
MTKKFFKYAVPSAIAMFISSMYTVIDGIFVGQGVGDSALAAVNIVLPFTVLLFGLASMFAIGGGALVSKNFGANNTEKAVNIFRQVFKFLLILSIGISIIGAFFTEGIVNLLGATQKLQTMSVEYLRFYALFCIPNLAGIVLSSFVRNDGRPKLAMVSTICGAVTNIILDYVFIFQLGFGIKGAAIATGLGQIVTVCMLLPHFLKGKGQLTFGKVRLNKEIIKEFSLIGFPSFFAQASYSIIVLLHNIALAKYVGDVGISAYSIINYLTTNIYMVLYGITLGVQPLLSYNYGRKDAEKLIGFFKITCISSLLISGAFVITSFVFGQNLIGIFTSDPYIAKLAYRALRVASFSYFVVGLNLNTLVYYQAIEKPMYSNISCICRSVIFLPICLFIFGSMFGINGIWISATVSESLTFITIKLIANVKTSTQAVFAE